MQRAQTISPSTPLAAPATPTKTGDSKVPTYGAVLRDELIRAFSGSLPAVGVSPIYRLGLLLLTLAMVLLPAAYVALVVAVGWVTWRHALNFDYFFGMASKRIGLLLYSVPLLAGAIATVFMVKPLFARPPRRAEPISLDPKNEPLLFAFVERLCQVVGAPNPKRIDIDCQVNASASFRRGFWSLFGRGDLVLTLGLPLTAGLSLQQLAGVLAHEFGHFAQGAGMRLTYVIRSISYWFHRVVHERDTLDEKLAEVASDSDHSFGLVALVAQLFVWLARRVLWVLMWVGQALSGFMLRQMEFDADRYEARLVGSTIFESTCHELGRLGLSYQQSLAALERSWREGRLADNLPAMVRAQRQSLEPEVLEALRRHAEGQKTALFDTHPADGDRIASARREGDRPLFRSSHPATVLFRDFAAVCRRVSRSFYQINLGQEIGPGDLIPLDQLLEGQERRRHETEALGRFFGPTLNPSRPFPIPAQTPAVATPPDLGATLRQLEERRHALATLVAGYRTLLEQYGELGGRRQELLAALVFIDGELSFEPRKLGLQSRLRDDVEIELNRLEERELSLATEAEPMERVCRERLEIALALLACRPLLERHSEIATLTENVPLWLDTARRLATSQEASRRLSRLRWQLEIALGQHQQNDQHQPLIQKIIALTAESYDELLALRDPLIGAPYPFDHADPETDLSSYVLPEGPLRDDVGQIYTLSSEALNRYGELTVRVMGCLATAGEQLEATLGLEPLELGEELTAEPEESQENP